MKDAMPDEIRLGRTRGLRACRWKNARTCAWAPKLSAPALTTERDWSKIDVGVRVEKIR